jgi:hypothetical protein
MKNTKYEIRNPKQILNSKFKTRKELEFSTLEFRPCFGFRDSNFGFRSEGIVLVGALIIMSLFMLIALAVADFSLNHFVNSQRTLQSLDALSVAEAGVDKLMLELNTAGSTYPGTGSCPAACDTAETTLVANTIEGKATFQTSTVDDGLTKVITATGKLYVPSTDTVPKVTRRVKVTVFNSAPVPYPVSSGPGGLYLVNNGSITSGQVYVNGFIDLANNATIGTAANPLPVNVAYLICPMPADSSYPVECTSEQSRQPLTFGNSSSHIYGDIKANWPGKSPGYDPTHMTNGGLIATSGVDPIILPADNRADIKSNICPGGTCAGLASPVADCPDQTWPANRQISGDVEIPNNCSVTVEGDIWITGKLKAKNNVTLKVATGLTTAPTIMIDCSGCADGSDSFTMGNSATIAANAGNIGFRFIAFWNKTGNPDITSLTGSDLANSQTVITINPGNGLEGAGSTLFYARWTEVDLRNNGTYGAVSGQTVKLHNNSNINFNGTGGAGGASSWDVKYYQPL